MINLSIHRVQNIQVKHSRWYKGGSTCQAYGCADLEIENDKEGIEIALYFNDSKKYDDFVQFFSKPIFPEAPNDQA